LGPTRLHDRGDQVLQDEGVAADIPARFQADPGMDLADLGDGIQVGLVKAGGGDLVPMRELLVSGAGHFLRVGEEVHGLGPGLDFRVQRVQRQRQGGQQHRLQRAEPAEESFVHIRKGEAVVERVGIRHRRSPLEANGGSLRYSGGA
jgi:hypothetical protein